jgi:hypothetical protein
MSPSGCVLLTIRIQVLMDISVHLELRKYNESVGTRDAISSKMGFLLYHLTAKL